MTTETKQELERLCDEALEWWDAIVERQNRRNRETGAHLASIGKADVA